MTTSVSLNVGGQLFATTLETLNKAPEGSMLHELLSGRFDTKKPSEDGSYFIDRDGTHFRYILNYLRTGQLTVPEDKIVRREILAEAEFYELEGIINELRPFKDSAILSPDQGKTLMNWLKGTQAVRNASDHLLYRASRNGWTVSSFHAFCNNKGPTVTVVKSRNYIFGGYNEQRWADFGGWQNAPNSFLFSLVNPSGLLPTKMPLKAGQEKDAIYCCGSHGPTFGRGNDLCIVNSSSKNEFNCSSTLGNTYKCPTGQKPSSFLMGKCDYIVSEMEVFGFEK